MTQEQRHASFSDLCNLARGPDFLANVERFEKSDFYKKFTNNLYCHETSIDKKNISYRVLNHWDEEGLLECIRDSEKGWRKFNLIEGFWVYTIQILRKMGLSFESLKKVKCCIFHPIAARKASISLEYYLACTLSLSKPVYLVITPDGTAELLEYSEYTNALSLQAIDYHIVLSVNEILKRMNLSQANKAIFPLEAELTSELYQVFESLREDDFEHATIRKKEGKIDRIEKTSTKSRDTKLHELLKEDANQDMVIKQRDGHVIFVTQTSIEKV